MGQAICKKLEDSGYNIFGIDKYIPDSFINSNCKMHLFSCDITNPKQIKETFEKISSITNNFYGIIHTSGIYDLDSLVEISEERFSKIFQVNLFGVFRINQQFLSFLNKNSRIVIVSSELAPLDPLPFTGLYAITKSALEKYAFSLRMELQLLGIQVSIIRPGAVKTSLLSDSTTALNKFVENTKLYKCNAQRFKKIVDSVEAKNINPELIACKALQAMNSKKTKYIYNINRNFLLRLLNFFPQKFQVFIIKLILKNWSYYWQKHLSSVYSNYDVSIKRNTEIDVWVLRQGL